MAKSDPRITVSLCVSGEFDPDDLSRVLAINPTEVRRAGEDTPRKRAKARKTSWCVTNTRHGDDSIEDGVCAMLELIWMHRDDLAKFADTWPVSLVLAVSVSFRQDRPEYSLSPSTLRRIADLGTTLVLDIYDLS